jgi:hypothetical protein
MTGACARPLPLIRASSEDAAPEFAPGSIDLVHVDGNHDEAAELEMSSLSPEGAARQARRARRRFLAFGAAGVRPSARLPNS